MPIKAQGSSAVGRTANIQWPQMPTDIFYKMTPEGQDALRKWYEAHCLGVQRHVDNLQSQIDQLNTKKS